MRRFSDVRLPLLGTGVLCLLPLAAHADPIRVTTGSTTVYAPADISGAVLSNGEGFLLGGDGFGSFLWAGGQPGDTRNLDGTFTFGSSSPSSARIDDASYVAYLSGSLDFSSVSFVLPPPGQNNLGEFATTFTMAGRVRGYADSRRQPDSLLFDVELFGTGSVKGFGAFNSGLGGYLPVGAATYTFAPADLSATPEPASLLLLGTGLAGLALRKRASSRMPADSD